MPGTPCLTNRLQILMSLRILFYIIRNKDYNNPPPVSIWDRAFSILHEQAHDGLFFYKIFQGFFFNFLLVCVCLLLPCGHLLGKG